MVKETAFYDILGVSPTATKDQIRKGDKEKEAEFKAVSEAYQVLFDDESRATYDSLGRDGLQGQGDFADARDVFAAVFGGPEFEPYIGTLKMCAPVDEKLQQEVEDASELLRSRHQELQQVQQVVELSDAELAHARMEIDGLRKDLAEKQRRLDKDNARIQKERVKECSRFLHTLIDQYNAAGQDSFKASMREELEKLRQSNMGEPILHTIGYIYVYQTQKILGKNAVGVHQIAGHWEDAREGFHKFAEVTGAIGSGVRLLRAHYKLSKDAKAEQGEIPADSKLSDEDRKWFEGDIQKKMLHMIWTLTKKDIEDTLRAVVETALFDDSSQRNSTLSASPDAAYSTSLSPAALRNAQAIILIGNIFLEAMPFDEFIYRDQPPTALERMGKDMEERARQAGIDVDGVKKNAAEAGEKASAIAAEAAIAAGTAINKLFGWTKK